MVITEKVIVESETNDSQAFIEEVRKAISTIITTPAGSIPLDRNFGIDMAFLGYPTDVAKEILAQEVIEKIELYEPRVIVDEIEFTSDASGGIVTVIKIIKNDDYEKPEDEDEDIETPTDSFYYDNEDYGADENIGEEEED